VDRAQRLVYAEGEQHEEMAVAGGLLQWRRRRLRRRQRRRRALEVVEDVGPGLTGEQVVVGRRTPAGSPRDRCRQPGRRPLAHELLDHSIVTGSPTAISPAATASAYTPTHGYGVPAPRMSTLLCLEIVRRTSRSPGRSPWGSVVITHLGTDADGQRDVADPERAPLPLGLDEALGGGVHHDVGSEAARVEAGLGRILRELLGRRRAHQMEGAEVEEVAVGDHEGTAVDHLILVDNLTRHAEVGPGVVLEVAGPHLLEPGARRL